MNSVQLIGNLARDPEVRYTKNGRAVALFTVACSRTYTPVGSSEQRELTDFIPCVAWGNLAETCGNSLSKGSRVFVQGRISVRSYDGPDGQKRYRTEVVCDLIAQTLGGTHTQSAIPNPPQTAAPNGGASNGGFGSMGAETHEDDIPF